MGLHMDGAGASGDVLLAHIASISGNVFTLDRNAGTTVSGASVEDDDTLAVQAALTSFCASPSNANGGSLYFRPEPTSFRRTSPSIPEAFRSTSRAPACICWEGTAACTTARLSCSRRPCRCWRIAGRAPTRSRCLPPTIRTGISRFKISVIDGCNQAVAVTSNVVRFWNTFLTAVGGGTDGSALLPARHLLDLFRLRRLTTNSTSVPTLLMGGYSCSGCYAGVGNVYMSNSLLAGGPDRLRAAGEPNTGSRAATGCSATSRRKAETAT